jgi:hypothetical protein
MPTPEAEEIIKTIWQETSDFLCGDAAMPDALYMVQTHAPRIDALCLQRISVNEEAWRRTVRLEREARAKVEAELRQYREGTA